MAYNVLNEPTQVQVDDLAPQNNQSISSVVTTAQYDSLGRLTQLVDPDRGTHTYSYDPDSHLLSDVSGSRTIGTNYDLLGRVGCVQDAAPVIDADGSCTSGSHPLVQNTYDTTKIGTQGSTDFPIGRLTKALTTTYFPEGGSATTSQKYQYDVRGRVITTQLLLTLPTNWNVSNALPTYQASLSYTDTNQPTTAITSSNPSGTGDTSTQVYDTTGALQGLGNSNNPTINLAALAYNVNALVGSITFVSSNGTNNVAQEQYSYDGNLRPIEATATWKAGSGNSGQIFDQSRSYDPASNVLSLTTTQASIPGQSHSGGSETENFCYDEQDRLVWAGNSGTQPGAGHGTCGHGTLGNTLNGASYNTPFAYTNLGELWQAPVGGTGGSQQYLYCDSNHPHQLSGIYPPGTTCSNRSGALYNTSNDAWGNVTSRTYNGSTATLSYDQLDRMVEWNNNSANTQEWYVYDASGNRVLRRSTTSGSTTITTYPFGSEEHTYSGNGTLQSSIYYYTLGGRLIGELTSSPAQTDIILTDALGSVLASFSNTYNNAALLGNQVYGPYGSQNYQSGNLGTNKGFTGHYADATGLGYYNARYYDPVASVFLSADSVQGNVQGMNPYGYVMGNPETKSDPTGKIILGQNGNFGHIDSNGYVTWDINAYAGWNPGNSTATEVQKPIYNFYTDTQNSPISKISQVTGLTDLQNTFNDPHASAWDKTVAIGNFISTNANNLLQLAMILGGGEGDAAELGGETIIKDVADLCGGGLSFTASTKVATPHGEQAIGSLKVGDKVWAYNPTTRKMELEPILHVWLNHDQDLVDLTLATTVKGTHGKPTQKEEVVHTNERHPFLTKEQGFVPVSHLTVGMHIRQADGIYGVVAKLMVVPGTRWMYNLEVAQDHTFAVGDGQWVVHNSNCGEIFSNTMASQLQKDLNLASDLGVTPIRVGDPGFQQMIQNGPIKWAISASGELSFIPKYVDGVEISHTAITGGADVLSAGEAEIINTGNGFRATMFNNYSGHYLPSEESLVIARQIFNEAGINFPSPFRFPIIDW